MSKPFCLSQNERLKSRKQIDGLFEKGRSFSQFPVRVSYQFTQSVDKPTLQIGVTASKRHFKKAVDRNRIKRLLRESYRLQKQLVMPALQASSKSGMAFFIYTDKTILSFATIKEAMAKCLKRLHTIALNETTK